MRQPLLPARLDPLAGEPWEAWKVFKAFLRVPVAVADEGISVQAAIEPVATADEALFLTMMRLFTTIEEGDDTPFRWVGLELTFAPATVPSLPDIELWSYDYEDLPAFIAAVESHPGFQQAMNAPVLASELVAQEV